MSAVDTINKLAQGFGQGFQNYQQGQQAQEAKALQAEALRRQQAVQGIDAAAKLSEMTGKAYTPELAGQYLAGTMDPNATLGLEYNQKYLKDKNNAELDKRYKESQIAKNLRGPQSNRLTLDQKLAEDAALDTAKRSRESKIADFEFADPSIIPSAKDAEEIKFLNTANKTFQDAGKRASEKVATLGLKDYTGLTNNWKSLEQDISEMQVQSKELAKLGALTGPDLDLTNKALGSLNKSTLAILGPEKAKKRIQEVLATANSKLANAAASRGYLPKGQQNVAGQKLLGQQTPVNTASAEEIKLAQDPARTQARRNRMAELKAKNGKN